MIKFGIKTAIFGSAVYYTVEKGVWRDSETTSAIYKDLEDGISPYVGELKKQIPYELPPLPTNDKLSYLTKYYWNCGVKKTFKFLANIPTHISDAASKSYGFVTSSLEALEPSQQSDKNVEK